MNHAEFFRVMADMMERGEDPCKNIEYMAKTAWKRASAINNLVYSVCIVGHPWRIRPRMIRVGDVEWPEPMKVAPPVGTPYWVVNLTRDYPYTTLRWDAGQFDLRNLERGLCHLTEEAAEAHSHALIELSGKVVVLRTP